MKEKTPIETLEETISEEIGIPIDQIRKMTLTEMRQYVESKTGEKMKIHDALTSEEVDKIFMDGFKDS